MRAELGGVLSVWGSQVWVSHGFLEPAFHFYSRPLGIEVERIFKNRGRVGAVAGTKPWSVALRMGHCSSYRPCFQAGPA